MDDRVELVIVDDDNLFFELISRLLKEDNCKVTGFTKQEDCLAYLSHATPAFLFVDMRMPRIDGLQFYTMLQNQGINGPTKMYLCSGASPTDKIRNELAAMRVEVIEKDNLCSKAWLRNILGFQTKTPLVTGM